METKRLRRNSSRCLRAYGFPLRAVILEGNAAAGHPATPAATVRWRDSALRGDAVGRWFTPLVQLRADIHCGKLLRESLVRCGRNMKAGD